MTDLIGQTIGNYRIEQLLGRGGMGQVFRGRHVTLDRLAAIKVIHEQMALDPSFQARFQKEARAAASLSHPNIVTIYDFGEHMGRAYLAMELIAGGSLRERLRDRAVSGEGWSLPEELELLRQAADGLAFAHSQDGMVHRDIKPDNLLLAGGPGEPPRLKIGDFGLARLNDGGNLTASGMTMGTPAYMSPEQCQGIDLDGRSDIYSLGIVIYEVATGRLPFIIRTAVDAAYKHIQEPPPPPREIRPDIPPRLEAIILRCLAKRPEERFASAEELAVALRQVIRSDAPGMQSQVMPVMLSELTSATPVTPGRTPAPRDAPAETSAPRLRVIDGQGVVQQIVDLGAPSLSVGRAADNDLVLDVEGVSRHHLLVSWDGRQATVTDLGSSGGTPLEGQPLTPHAAQAWPWGAQLRVGPYLLRVDPPAPPAQRGAQPIGIMASGALNLGQMSQSFAATDRLEIRLESPVAALPPGQAVPLRVLLINRGSVDDLLTVTVSGIPEGWVTGAGTATLLKPGEQATVTLTVLVPRTAESEAGDRLVKLRVRSRERPAEGASAEGRWTVLPFGAADLAVAPARASGRTRARYRVSVHNTGNATARYRLAADDELGLLRYSFEPDQIEVAAGQTASARLDLECAGRLAGRPAGQRFSVRAEPTDGAGEAADATAQFVQLALVPGWAFPAAAALLALLLLCMFGVLPSQMAGRLPFYGILAAVSRQNPREIRAPTPAPGAPMFVPTTLAATALPTDTPTGTPTSAATSPTATGLATPDASATAGAVLASAGQTATAAGQQLATTTAQAAVSGATTTALAQLTTTAAARPTATLTATPTEPPTEEPTEDQPTQPISPTATTPTAPPTNTPTATRTPTPTATPTSTPVPTPSFIPTATPPDVLPILEP